MHFVSLLIGSANFLPNVTPKSNGIKTNLLTFIKKQLEKLLLKFRYLQQNANFCARGTCATADFYIIIMGFEI